MHITAHAQDAYSFIAGCTCGWVGQRRATFQAMEADKIVHDRDSRTMPNFRPAPCGEQGCPVC